MRSLARRGVSGINKVEVNAMIHHCTSCQTKNRIPVNKLDQPARCGRCKTSISPLDAPHEVTSEAEFDDLIRNAPIPVLVDFWATWCAPCRMVAPELVKLARMNAGRVVVAKVDTDELPRVASRYDIKGIPTMLLFKDGQVAQQISGAQPAQALSNQLGL